MFIFQGVPVTYYDIGPPTHQCHNCGATMWYEEREEKSKTSANLTFTLCCKGGKVLLPRFHDTPPPLDNLLSHDQRNTCNLMIKPRTREMWVVMLESKNGWNG
ncbi:hypothetical protein Tco_1573746 [Tanacetum coccineum]